MAAKSCSDEDFVRLFQEHRSVTKVARELGISAKCCSGRRDRLENRLGVLLQLDAPTAKPERQVTVQKHSAVVRLDIADGVVLVGSDAHIWPGPLSTMQRAFLHIAERLTPDVIVANGDFCDFGQISRWPSLSWADSKAKPAVKDELAAVQDYMGELAKHSRRLFWPFGNHDQRFEARIIAAAGTEFEGVHGLSLKDHFPAWVPCWRVDINDDVIVRHRELAGEHADYRNAVNTGKTMVTGHDHRTGVTPYRSYGGVRYGVRCGYLADGADDPQFIEYLEAREPNWHPAFVVLTFKGGHLLYPELVTKHADGVVQFRGELIEV